MSKLHMACLMELYEGTKRLLSWSNICSFVFGANRSCGENIGAIAMLHRAGYEWRGHEEVWTFSGNILATFYELDQLIADGGMTAAGTHPGNTPRICCFGI